MKKKYCYIKRILMVSFIAFALLAVIFLGNSNLSDESKQAQPSLMQTIQTQEYETEILTKNELEDLSQMQEIVLEEDLSQTQEIVLENDPKEELLYESFFYTEITDEIKARITGISYPDTVETLQITYDDLSYVHVLHYDFYGQVQQGELICNRVIAQDLVDIFTKLYENHYPIEKICLIDEYGGDDEASMQDNNTSCFNYRTIANSTKLSNHSYGLAIDINPKYNPYVRTRNGKLLISPDNGAEYTDRSAQFMYKIDKEDLCYKLFTEYGFTWGGEWNNSKDYQHFEKRQKNS